MEKCIDAYTFADIAHYKIFNSQDVLTYINDIIKKNSIIFVKRNILNTFFNKLIYYSSSQKYILITHLDDESINVSDFNKKPSCIIKWFAENASYNHPDLIPIPLGLKNYIGLNGESITKTYKWFIQNINKLFVNEKNIENVYCSWTIDTNIHERSNVLKYLKVKYIKENGHLPYETYCENMSKHKFVLAPQGYAIDTYRVWDALYMGCFPVVIKHNIYKEFDDLPIIQINNWGEITYDLLYSYLNKEYNYEKLYTTYWQKRITEEFNKI